MHSGDGKRQFGNGGCLSFIYSCNSRLPSARLFFYPQRNISVERPVRGGVLLGSRPKPALSEKPARSSHQGRLKNPKNAQLWTESIRTEINAGDVQQGKNLLAKALQECPQSGIIQAEAIWMESRPQRRSRSVEAVRKRKVTPLTPLYAHMNLSFE